MRNKCFNVTKPLPIYRANKTFSQNINIGYIKIMTYIQKETTK